MAAAARWLSDEAPAADRFLLFVDEFDPHEPFDTPEPYASMYDDTWEGPHMIWPPYMRGAVQRGVLSPEQARQVRAQYGGKLTMIDRWLQKVLDEIDFETTAVIVCTDHGHYLGERDIWGKPPSPLFETMSHIPLLVAWPGEQPRVEASLTTSVDLFATILDVFGVRATHHTHGRSLVPLITGSQVQVRDHVLAGVWGREVHLFDDRTKYCRAPDGANAPLSLWSNRWSTMPVWTFEAMRMPPPDDRATLDHMPHTPVPVIRQPFVDGDMLPYWALGEFDGNHLYDIAEDPDEENNLATSKHEKEAADRLREALKEIEAPGDQFERLGLR
jgi:arylsulfatase A-like enzyme